MEEKSNVFKYLFIVFLVLTCVLGGFIIYDRFIKETPSNVQSNDENNNDNDVIDNEEDSDDDNDNDVIDNLEFTFSDYAKLLDNTPEEYVQPTGYYSAISEFYLKNNQVYVSFKSSSDLERIGITEADIDKIKKLELDKDNLYKLPLQDIVLIDSVRVGQDGSSIIFFEDRNGKVYSFHASQTGVFNYPLFNQDGNINIEEESNLKNIVKFGSSSKNDSIYFFGIDINGKIINEL